MSSLETKGKGTEMKKFVLACVGFSLLCMVFACGQQAFKQPANAAAVGSGGQWVHATTYDPLNHSLGTKGLLNLQHVTFIGSAFGLDNMASAGQNIGNGQEMFQIDAADVPK